MGGIKNKLSSKLSNKTLSKIPLWLKGDVRRKSDRGIASDTNPLGSRLPSFSQPSEMLTRNISNTRTSNRRGLYASKTIGSLRLVTLTKYLAISCFTLAILSTLILNIISSYSSSKIETNAIDSNSKPSTLANDSSICDPSNTDAPLCVGISISSHSATGDSNDGNLSLTIPQGGGLVAGRHTVKMVTNSISGARLELYATGSTDLQLSNGASTIPAKRIECEPANYSDCTSILQDNTWGIAAPEGMIAGGTGGYGSPSAYEQYIDNPGPVGEGSSAPTFSGIIPAQTTRDGSINYGLDSVSSNASQSTNVYYGVRVDNPMQLVAGNYQVNVQYTAIVDEQQKPYGLSISPNEYEIGSGKDNSVTISGKQLRSVYHVWIDLNGDRSRDANEECVNLDVVSNSRLTCDMPTDATVPSLAAGTYTVYVQTQSGEKGELDNAFTYTKPSICRNADPDSDCRVDIDDNMVPVTYDESRQVWIALNEQQINSLTGIWYDYGAKKWANAVTVKNPDNYRESKDVNEDDILGYWVYIPRYAYKVMRYSVNDKYVSDITATSDGGFEIVFETKDTPKKIPQACSNSNSNQYYQDCSNVSQDYGATTGTAWATHPAFTWGTEEINGFWIGKFETTGSTSQPTVLPNQKHMSMYNRGNIGDYYDIAKSMGVADPNNMYGKTAITNQSNQNNNNLAILTSHMLKNSEWGAVAYLSASKYGAGVNNVQINSQYQSGTDGNGDSSYGVTGCGPSASGATGAYTGTGTLGTNTACNSSDTSRAYNGSKGVLASTTNNVYGVYDMSGGAWEYVMGSYTTNASQSSTSYFGNATKPPYVDLYVRSTFSGTNYTNNNLCTWATCGGHALYETKNVQSVSGSNQSWGGDYSYFVLSSSPWFLRGGIAYNGSNAGVFVSGGSSGNTYNYYGFRVALMSLAPAGQ